MLNASKLLKDADGVANNVDPPQLKEDFTLSLHYFIRPICPKTIRYFMSSSHFFADVPME